MFIINAILVGRKETEFQCFEELVNCNNTETGACCASKYTRKWNIYVFPFSCVYILLTAWKFRWNSFKVIFTLTDCLFLIR